VQGYRLLPRRDALTARHRHRYRCRRPAHAADRNAQTRISPRWRRYIHPPPQRPRRNSRSYVHSTSIYSLCLSQALSLSLPSHPRLTLYSCCLLADHPAISLVISPSFQLCAASEERAPLLRQCLPSLGTLSSRCAQEELARENYEICNQTASDCSDFVFLLPRRRLFLPSIFCSSPVFLI